ncbi:MAG: hypothetical protein K0R29_1571 [Pseudobdellovibrio sp.]|nr:hypothetical protein [Pseudobdellovibrio sp.]
MQYKAAAVAIIFAIICRIFLVSVYKMPSHSMAPTVLSGDFILASQVSFGFKFPVNKETYFRSTPQQGELVIFTKAGKSFVKRVVAVPGMDVEYAENQLTVNATKCRYENASELDLERESVSEICSETRSTIRAKDSAKSTFVAPAKLGPNQYLVAADNRFVSESNPNPVEIIDYDQIVGKPLMIWMSYGSTQDFISKTLGIRWNRILTILK